MLQINEKNTFLTKLYPMTKIWVSVELIVTVFVFSNYYISAVIYLLALAIILKEKMMKQFKVLIIATIILGISLFSIQGIFNPINQTVVWCVIPGTKFIFYKEGLLLAGDVYCRIVPLLAVLFLAIRTLNITELGVALNRAGVSYKVSFVLTSTFQAIPVFNKEIHQIMDAQKTRGLKTDGNLISRVKVFVPVMVPLISNSIMNVQNQVIALESKGFNADIKKTYYRDPQKSKADTIIVVVSTVLTIIAVTYRLLVFFGSFK